jgi:hypothetical protein
MPQENDPMMRGMCGKADQQERSHKFKELT